ADVVRVALGRGDRRRVADVRRRSLRGRDPLGRQPGDLVGRRVRAAAGAVGGVPAARLAGLGDPRRLRGRLPAVVRLLPPHDLHVLRGRVRAVRRARAHLRDRRAGGAALGTAARAPTGPLGRGRARGGRAAGVGVLLADLDRAVGAVLVLAAAHAAAVLGLTQDGSSGGAGAGPARRHSGVGLAKAAVSGSPPVRSPRSSASIASMSSGSRCTPRAAQFSAMRDGVTDFGITTLPCAMCQASTTWAGVASRRSAISASTGSSSRPLPEPSGDHASVAIWWALFHARSCSICRYGWHSTWLTTGTTPVASMMR